jgi:glycosyltransferase involved in cell wall biosynthesis
MPRVSIGLPVYNGERFVANALVSILGQTFGDFELIISDNGSTDRTREICRSFAARDSRIAYQHSETNRGAAWNFNRVFELAGGDYFKWAAADDVLEPEYLARCVELLDRAPEIVLCHSHTGKIDVQGQQVGDYRFGMRLDSPRSHERFHDLIVVRHNCIDIFGVVRSQVLRRTPRIGAYVGSDRVLLAELSLHGKLHEVPEILFWRRSHDENSVCLDERSDRLAWFDPRLAGRISLPHWRILREYLAALRRAPLGAAERWRCARQLLSHIRVRSRFLGQDLLEAFKGLLGRSRAGQRVLHTLKQIAKPSPG